MEVDFYFLPILIIGFVFFIIVVVCASIIKMAAMKKETEELLMPVPYRNPILAPDPIEVTPTTPTVDTPQNLGADPIEEKKASMPTQDNISEPKII